MLMFSLLLNIYAKWHPEMFNPYLRGSPGVCGDVGGVVRRPGTEVGKCRRCTSTRSSAVVRCKTPVLAFGFRPGERNMTLLQLEQVCTLASIYMPSVLLRELDTQGGRAERFRGVLGFS